MEEQKEQKKANPVRQRLKQFIATQGISEREFCRRIGVSSGYIESIKQSISPKVMQTISMQYPELNPLWLLMGSGEMTKSSKDETPRQSSRGMLPSEMLAELLIEARNEKARLLTANERLTEVVQSQQETIAELTREIKKINARPEEDATCAAVG